MVCSWTDTYLWRLFIRRENPSLVQSRVKTGLGIVDSVRAAGLTIVPMGETAADLSLKGYFSVVNDDGRVSVVYVWDVIGSDGLRLHRIQGSEAALAGGFSGSDPWEAVTPEMMADVGQKSVGSLLAWLDSQG